MSDLFETNEPTRLQMEGADVTFHRRPDLGMEPRQLLRILRRDIPWEQRSIRIQGREIPQPRLVSWHGEAAYAYSGLKLTLNPWTPTLLALRDRVQEITGASYNSVLLNLYRNGRDSIGFHADDEPELGSQPTIASISLGASRTFALKRKDRTGRRINVELEHGSLLVMAGDTQKNWLHGIDKTGERKGERINLTFRQTA